MQFNFDVSKQLADCNLILFYKRTYAVYSTVCYCLLLNFTPFITGSAVHGCKAHSKINRKMGNSTPCKIVTPKNFNLKLCIRDYVGEATYHANFGSNRFSGGFSPYRRNITTLWLFVLTVLSCPVLSCPFFSRERAQVEPLNRFSRFMAQTTCFRARKCLLGVKMMGDVIWGKYTPKTPQKWAWIGNFKPKR